MGLGVVHLQSHVAVVDAPLGFWVEFELALVLGGSGPGVALLASSSLRLIPTASVCWGCANKAKSTKRVNITIVSMLETGTLPTNK